MNHQSEKWLFLYTKMTYTQSLDLGSEVAVDTETMGLKFRRDRLCLVQLADIRGQVYLVQIDKNQKIAPNLANIMTDESVVKIFIMQDLILVSFIKI